MARAYLALGGNLGDRLATLGSALRAVDGLSATAVRSVSRVYESESWPDAGDPPYANAVAVIETGMEADALLGSLKEIELRLGRVEGLRNAPRPIDLDILLFGDEEWAGEELTIPHPRLAEREFVVIPLLEADPAVTMPDGTPVSADAARFGRIISVLGTVPGFVDVTRITGAAPAGSGGSGRDSGEEWVVVAESGGTIRLPATPDVELIYKRTILEGEGIPYVWDPYAPEDASNPYGIEPVFRLRVPAALADRAKTALAEAASAVPIPDDDPGSD